MRRLLLLLLLAPLTLLAPGPARASMGGQPTDRLDWPGTPTDRYLDAEEVRTVLHAASDAFFDCFARFARGADASDVGITFTIGRDGLIGGFVAELGVAPPELGTCLEQTTGELAFGEHDGDPFEVSYPLVYHVDARGARILPYPVVFTRPRPVRLPLLALPPDFTLGEIRMLELIFTDETGATLELPPKPEPTAEEAPAAPPEATSEEAAGDEAD